MELWSGLFSDGVEILSFGVIVFIIVFVMGRSGDPEA